MNVCSDITGSRGQKGAVGSASTSSMYLVWKLNISSRDILVDAAIEQLFAALPVINVSLNAIAMSLRLVNQECFKNSINASLLVASHHYFLSEVTAFQKSGHADPSAYITR